MIWSFYAYTLCQLHFDLDDAITHNLILQLEHYVVLFIYIWPTIHWTYKVSVLHIQNIVSSVGVLWKMSLLNSCQGI